MVTVCMLRQGGEIVGFEARGHAEFSQDGDGDIVCSAVSALTQTIALGLTQRLQLPVGLSIEEGNMHCVLGRDCTSEQCAQAGLLFDTLLLGLRSMELAYGKYLSISEREV